MQVVPPITINSTEGAFTRTGSVATFVGSNGLLQTASANVLRTTYDPVTLECLGTLIELAATNLVLNSATLVTQNVTTTAVPHTLSFYGTGQVVLSGTGSGTLVGTGAYPNRVTLTFTPTAGTLTLTVTGSVTEAQLEVGGTATSYIPTVGATVTRGADTFTGTAPALCYSDVPDTHTASAWVSGSAYATGDKVTRSTTNCVYRCIRTITASSVPSTTLPEASVLLETPYWTRVDAIPWQSGTTYTFVSGENKQVTYNKRTYQLIATTTVNTTLPTSTSPSYWVDAGPSNRWASFDLLRNSASKNRDQLTIVLSTGTRVDTAVLVGMQGVRKAIINVYSATAGGTLYTLNKDLTNREPTSWYNYFFTDITTSKSTVFTDLPPYSDAIISITLLGTDLELGGAVLGKAVYLGSVQRGITSDVINFSTVTRDVFGNATMVQRRNVPKTNQTLFADKSLINNIRAVRDQLNATPAAWIGLEDLPDQYYFETLLIIGFYKNFTINIDNPINITVNLELEEI